MVETAKIITYSAFGFKISSEFFLPELNPIQCEKCELDLIINRQDLSVLWSKNAQTDSYYYVEENYCMIRVPDVGIYKIENGSTISVSPFEGSDDGQIRLYILGTCMGVVLMQRRILPLHGSCIAINGKTYAIVGDSGAGKSTLASAFINKGFSLLTDDVIAVKLSKDNIPIVTPSYPHQKLWQESLNQFGMKSNQFKPIYGRETKFAIPIKDNFFNKPMPLAGIFELIKTEKCEIEILPVKQLERFPILYYNTYRNFMINRFNLIEWHFEYSSKLVSHLNFYRIFRPNSRFTANELVDHILDVINRK